jgi:hypothetical protein
MNMSYLICQSQSADSYAKYRQVFNYILYRLHTGCQRDQIPVDTDPNDPEKKRSAITQSITTSVSGAAMGACKEYGKEAS